jgi:ethanolaminephosphotransferase
MPQITLSGFGFIIVNFLTMLWYTPTLDQDCPPWVYASWAIGLFLYQTFDAVDGSQARRTRQSGPLGELFDHGVDAINTTLEVLLFSATMNLGQGWKTVLTLFACKPASLYYTISVACHVTDCCSIVDLLRADLG